MLLPSRYLCWQPVSDCAFRVVSSHVKCLCIILCMCGVWCFVYKIKTASMFEIVELVKMKAAHKRRVFV